MNCLTIATIAYLLIALQTILDKFLLSSKRVNYPAVYAFYSGVMSFFTLILFPFGFHAIGADLLIQYIFSGALFTFGMLFLFFAIQKSEASRVIPVVGVVIPLVTYFLSVIFLKDNLSPSQIWGVIILILGGFLISWLRPEAGKRHSFFDGFYQAIASGVLLAVAYTLFKRFYQDDNFMDVFIWTRLGLFVGALTLLLVGDWRKNIFSSLANFKNPSHEQQSSGLLFVVNKIFGGVGSALLNFSMSLGNITVINALVSLEYVFIFIFGISFSFWLPRVFQEKRDWRNFIQKISAIAVIAIGIALVSKIS